MGVFARAVDLAAFVVVWEILGDGKTFLIAEEQSMAVFPALHLVAGTDPGAGLHLFGFVLVEVAGTERPAKVIDVLGQPDHEEFGDVVFRVQIAAALLSEGVDELPHPRHRFLAGLIAIRFVYVVDVRHASSSAKGIVFSVCG
jgi:hypothetical protein